MLNVLFVCVENACRSQLAEQISNSIYGNKIFAQSAGSQPAKTVNPKAIDSLKNLGKRKNISISCSCSKGKIVLADKNALERILNNLIENAFKYSEPESTIHVSTKKVKDHLNEQIHTCFSFIACIHIDIFFTNHQCYVNKCSKFI